MMKRDEDLWMRKMRKALEDYSEPPAPDGWSKLEKELSPAGEKRIRPYVRWVAAAVLLLAVSGISLFLIDAPVTSDTPYVAVLPQATTPDVMPQTQVPEVGIAQTISGDEPIVPSKHNNPSVSAGKDKGNAGHDLVAVAGNEPEKKDENIENKSNPIVEKSVEQPPQYVTGKDVQNRTEQPEDNRKIIKPSGKDKLHLPVATEKKRSSDGKWSLTASVSNAAGVSISESGEYMAMIDASPSLPSESNSLTSGLISITDKDELVFEGGLPYVKQSVTVNEMKHKQPISFGLSARKNLSNGFSVESGVTYTLLSSEGKLAGNGSQKIKQELHYIGIPIRGNWDFAESKLFTFYLTAGGMVEKCVYGKIGTESHTVKPLQFSLTGGIGGQVNVSKRIGIYVEPGIAYFFDDGSEVETIRKENPVNLNLQAGVRFNF